jgi:hypothetical protein
MRQFMIMRTHMFRFSVLLVVLAALLVVFALSEILVLVNEEG